jgi:putative nucleotidyltransferase with HDIG domain
MRRRVLFVDDDSRVLEGLQDNFARSRPTWEAVFAGSGEAALEEFRKRSFDVIVSDLRMPGMGGIALLDEIRKLYPEAVRIFLSGQPEPEVGLRLVPVCHQFLAKPCDAGSLLSVVDRACWLQDLVPNGTLTKVIGGISRLPALPSLYVELQRLIAEDQGDPSNIARVVGQDVAMSAKVLQILNSTYFALSRRITAIEQAVVYLGVPTIQQLVLASVFDGATLRPRCGVELGRLRDHALLTAAIARNMFLEDRTQASLAWTAGMLHDVGKLVLGSGLPDHLPAALDLASRSSRPLFEAEQELYGVTHSEIGAYVLGLWGLPQAIVEAVANHHHPARGCPRGLDLTIAVYVASALANECAANECDTNECDTNECIKDENVPGITSVIDVDLLESLNVLEHLNRWRVTATELHKAAVLNKLPV